MSTDASATLKDVFQYFGRRLNRLFTYLGKSSLLDYVEKPKLRSEISEFTVTDSAVTQFKVRCVIPTGLFLCTGTSSVVCRRLTAG